VGSREDSDSKEITEEAEEEEAIAKKERVVQTRLPMAVRKRRLREIPGVSL
jgi:transposase